MSLYIASANGCGGVIIRCSSNTVTWCLKPIFYHILWWGLRESNELVSLGLHINVCWRRDIVIFLTWREKRCLTWREKRCREDRNPMPATGQISNVPKTLEPFIIWMCVCVFFLYKFNSRKTLVGHWRFRQRKSRLACGTHERARNIVNKSKLTTNNHVVSVTCKQHTLKC